MACSQTRVFTSLRRTLPSLFGVLVFSARARTTITSPISPTNLHGVPGESGHFSRGLGPRQEDPDLSEPLRWIPYRADAKEYPPDPCNPDFPSPGRRSALAF